MTTRQMIEIMEAFEKGAKIQRGMKWRDDTKWFDDEEPKWDWQYQYYRIKV